MRNEILPGFFSSTDSIAAHVYVRNMDHSKSQRGGRNFHNPHGVWSAGNGGTVCFYGAYLTKRQNYNIILFMSKSDGCGHENA